MTVSFAITPVAREIINKIAARAEDIALSVIGTEVDTLSLMMDLAACHANGTPLDLARLLDADQSTFIHDVWGIRKYIDRETGKLTDFFLPRCAL